MGFWSGCAKVVVGAGAGVACVVAAPVLGAVGSVTAVGAGIGAGVGALGGLAAEMMDDSDEKLAQEKEKREQAEREKATAGEQQRRANDTINEMKSNETAANRYFNYILTLQAVGFYAASVSGKVSKQEYALIEQFIAGSACEALPEAVKKQQSIMFNNPPHLDKVMDMLSVVHKDHRKLAPFNDVIELINQTSGINQKRTNLKENLSKLLA
jgi:Sec-independent protein translocase protein TatA